MYIININKTSDQHKYKMTISKDENIIHTYIDTYDRLLGMCLLLIDIDKASKCKDIDLKNIYINNKIVY